MKYITTLSIPLFLTLSLCSCTNKSDTIDEPTDEVVYISEEFLTDDNTSSQPNEVMPVENTKKNTKKQSIAVAVAAKSASYYKNYKRQSDAPEEFAKASVWHAINMVYSETFSAPQIKILDAKNDGDKLLLSLQISWSDRWVNKPYIIKGNLEVNTDGSNGKFVITSKNLEAESLEFTNPNTKNSLQLPTI